MKQTRWMQKVLLALVIVVLAGCHSKHKNSDDSVDEANAAYSGGAQSSGLGGNGGFGDDGKGQPNRNHSERTYYFAYDSSQVREDDKPAIMANANYLMSHSQAKVLLEGHTDPRGSREYNIGLGERRAKAVAALMTMQGVNPHQIRIVSYGSEKLAATGYTEAEYQKDRRVVLVYLQR